MSDGRVRIQKALADAGIASRRRAEEMVAAGRIGVNGVIATIGQVVDPAVDQLTVDGRRVGQQKEQRVYLAMAKPAGSTSTVSDPHARRTVVDLVPAELRRGASRLYPVGRLDRESEGLLLLTNDGPWAQRMLHPSHGIEREYAVGLDHPLDDEQWRNLENGVTFEEGMASIAHLAEATRADVRMLSRLIGSDATKLVWYRATLRQGMKRQLRRMFSVIGAPVRRLVRLRFGTIRLTDMAIGDVRALTGGEKRQLESMAAAAEPDPGPRAPAKEADGAPGNTPGSPLPGLVVSIDGPGGSGKSTVGAGAAERVGYRFCDTGVLYRGLTWLALERGANLDDPQALIGLVEHLELAPDERQRYVRLMVDGREVTDLLHTAEVDREVSRVSRHPEVRARLLPLQHALASGRRIVMAGRDIGTVVLPDAEPKIYLEVSIEERARRRAAERRVADDAQSVAEIGEELRKRDGIDSTRKAAPLRIPIGAVLIRTDGNTLDETIDEVVAAIREREQDMTKARA